MTLRSMEQHVVEVLFLQQESIPKATLPTLPYLIRYGPNTYISIYIYIYIDLVSKSWRKTTACLDFRFAQLCQGAFHPFQRGHARCAAWGEADLEEVDGPWNDPRGCTHQDLFRYEIPRGCPAVTRKEGYIRIRYITRAPYKCMNTSRLSWTT